MRVIVDGSAVHGAAFFRLKDEIWRSHFIDGRGRLAQRLLPREAPEQHESFLGFLGTLLRTAEAGDLSTGGKPAS
jgi:hypothetical protein